MEQIKGNFVEQYFQDVDVASLTENRSNCITQYRKALYFSNYDAETGKTTRQEKIGYISALAIEHNLVGASYLDVTNIIFEEFMSRTYYLKDEPTKLMNFYCTVDRKRGTTRMWLLGNSITRVCPYIQEWGLHKLFSNMKQGDIEEVYIDSYFDEEKGEMQKVKLAIEYCRSSGRSSYTIGLNKDMMNNR